MKYARIGALAALLLIPTIAVVTWIHSAEARLAESDAEAAAPTPTQAAAGSGSVAVASVANAQYCSPDLKKILRRVLLSCGLVSGGGGGDARGCQPVQAKNVATMSGADFNALFQPMKDRGGIIEFDKDSAVLDADDKTLIDKEFGEDQGGASWFFIVARASPEGSVAHNRELSKARAQAVMDHLKQQFPDDPDLDNEVGLLWLGEEYAQLDDQFCAWRRSNGATCTTEDLNRSAFVAWIDCQL